MNEGWAALRPEAPRRRALIDPCGLVGNPSVVAVHGRVGNVVYKTYRDGRIVVTRVPSFAGYVPSAAQRARRTLMRAATAYAKRVYADPAAKARYVVAAQKLGRQPFRLAISDYLAIAKGALPRTRPACPRAAPTTCHPDRGEGAAAPSASRDQATARVCRLAGDVAPSPRQFRFRTNQTDTHMACHSRGPELISAATPTRSTMACFQNPISG